MYSDLALFERNFGVTTEDVVVVKEGNDFIVGLKCQGEIKNFDPVLRELSAILE